MPLYQWVRIDRDEYESKYAVLLVEKRDSVKQVNTVWLEGHDRPEVFMSRNSTNPDESISDDESD